MHYSLNYYAIPNECFRNKRSVDCRASTGFAVITDAISTQEYVENDICVPAGRMRDTGRWWGRKGWIEDRQVGNQPKTVANCAGLEYGKVSMAKGGRVTGLGRVG